MRRSLPRGEAWESMSFSNLSTKLMKWFLREPEQRICTTSTADLNTTPHEYPIHSPMLLYSQGSQYVAQASLELIVILLSQSPARGHVQLFLVCLFSPPKAEFMTWILRDNAFPWRKHIWTKSRNELCNVPFRAKEIAGQGSEVKGPREHLRTDRGKEKEEHPDEGMRDSRWWQGPKGRLLYNAAENCEYGNYYICAHTIK